MCSEGLLCTVRHSTWPDGAAMARSATSSLHVEPPVKRGYVTLSTPVEGIVSSRIEVRVHVRDAREVEERPDGYPAADDCGTEPEEGKRAREIGKRAIAMRASGVGAGLLPGQSAPCSTQQSSSLCRHATPSTQNPSSETLNREPAAP